MAPLAPFYTRCEVKNTKTKTGHANIVTNPRYKSFTLFLVGYILARIRSSEPDPTRVARENSLWVYRRGRHRETGLRTAIPFSGCAGGAPRPPLLAPILRRSEEWADVPSMSSCPFSILPSPSLGWCHRETQRMLLLVQHWVCSVKEGHDDKRVRCSPNNLCAALPLPQGRVKKTLETYPRRVGT